jgi:hypothetical protein
VSQGVGRLGRARSEARRLGKKKAAGPGQTQHHRERGEGARG